MHPRIITAFLLSAAAITGCVTAPAPGPDTAWLARQEVRYQAPEDESFCDVIGGVATSAARACAGGVPRSKAMAVPHQLTTEVPDWLPPILETIIAQAYDLPSARAHPDDFGDMHAAICRQFMEEGRP